MTQVLPSRTAPDYWNDNRDAVASVWGYGDATNYFPMGTTAGQRAIAGFFETRATSGDTRAADFRLKFSGTGGSGEALRAFGTVNGVSAATGGTVNGAHISLAVNGAAGAVSGAGTALRATLGVGAGCTPGGTISALQVDSDFDATATVSANVAAIRLTNSNTGTWPNLLQIPAASNGTIFAAHTTQTMTHSIRIRDANNTAYYIMCTNAATNRS
jgi:hypothetical protein